MLDAPNAASKKHGSDYSSRVIASRSPDRLLHCLQENSQDTASHSLHHLHHSLQDSVQDVASDSPDQLHHSLQEMVHRCLQREWLTTRALSYLNYVTVCYVVNKRCCLVVPLFIIATRHILVIFYSKQRGYFVIYLQIPYTLVKRDSAWYKLTHTIK